MQVTSIKVFVLCLILLCSCDGINSINEVKKYLIGTWRIENPNLQSFIQFKKNGDAIYYFNQYSFKLDSLKERGVWEVAFLEKKSLKDTFLITILSKNKITLKSQILDSTHFLIFEEGRKTRFTRIH